MTPLLHQITLYEPSRLLAPQGKNHTFFHMLSQSTQSTAFGRFSHKNLSISICTAPMTGTPPILKTSVRSVPRTGIEEYMHMQMIQVAAISKLHSGQKAPIAREEGLFVHLVKTLRISPNVFSVCDSSVLAIQLTCSLLPARLVFIIMYLSKKTPRNDHINSTG